MSNEEKKATLTGRGWTSRGADFLLSKELPATWLHKLFGEKHERRQPKDKCVRCGYQGPALDWHHIHGRKNSSKTIVLCANCHREVHAGQPLEKP